MVHTMTKPVYTANTWDYDRFASLWDYNPKEALAYRDRCFAKKDVVLENATTADAVASASNELTKIDLESAEIKEEKQKEDLRKLLKDANIPFHHLAGLTKLLNLAVEHNLVKTPTTEAPVETATVTQSPAVETAPEVPQVPTVAPEVTPAVVS